MSKPALVVFPTPTFNPVGQGAKYLRVSGRDQDENRQREATDNWLRRRGLDSEVFEFADHGRRHHSETRADFQRLLDWVRDGRVRWILVQSLDRFGIKDAYELMFYLHQLRQANCQLWVAETDKCISDGDDAT